MILSYIYPCIYTSFSSDVNFVFQTAYQTVKNLVDLSNISMISMYNQQREITGEFNLTFLSVQTCFHRSRYRGMCIFVYFIFPFLLDLLLDWSSLTRSPCLSHPQPENKTKKVPTLFGSRLFWSFTSKKCRLFWVRERERGPWEKFSYREEDRNSD